MEEFCLKLLKGEKIVAPEFLDVERVWNNGEVKVEDRGMFSFAEVLQRMMITQLILNYYMCQVQF